MFFGIIRPILSMEMLIQPVFIFLGSYLKVRLARSTQFCVEN
ncbi:MAG: hypothetical protein P4M11_08465 [Candidatus Pacebacteria bacterium]|nr:hypothetical protein [Candidatus Paceibacterota bacterium]